MLKKDQSTLYLLFIVCSHTHQFSLKSSNKKIRHLLLKFAKVYRVLSSCSFWLYQNKLEFNCLFFSVFKEREIQIFISVNTAKKGMFLVGGFSGLNLCLNLNSALNNIVINFVIKEHYYNITTLLWYYLAAFWIFYSRHNSSYLCLSRCNISLMKGDQ